MRIIPVLLCLLVCCTRVFSQFPSPQTVPGLPTEIVYDLLVDSRGFLWVAHASGISRFDGSSFTHFHNEHQTALGVTDLVEDRQGKIWCHNFNAQVFYVKDEKLHWLKDYKDVEEKSYPRMVLYGDELAITSAKGLFLCNTASLKTRLLQYPGAHSESIAVSGNTVVTTDNNSWMQYSGKDWRPLPLQNSLGRGSSLPGALQPFALKDTIYDQNNASKEVHAYRVENGRLVLKRVIPFDGFVNTLSLYKGELWVHTKLQSFAAAGNQKLSGLNVTDIVTDRQGVTWISSLQKGLLLLPHSEWWKKENTSFLGEGDFVRCMELVQNNLVYGTQQGKIIVQSMEGAVSKMELPPAVGAVERFFYFDPDKVLVGPSIGLYIAAPVTHTIYPLSTHSTVNGLIFTDTAIRVAYPFSLASIPLTPEIESAFLRKGLEKKLADSLVAALEKKIRFIGEKCHGVYFHRPDKTLYAAFKNGLCRVDAGDSIRPLLFNKERIYASSLLSSATEGYASTYNQGFFILRGNTIQNVSARQGLLSNIVLKMKRIGEDLFLVFSGGLQVWNTRSQKITATLPLPQSSVGSVYDLARRDHTLYLSTAEGIYSLPLSSLSQTIQPPAFLLSVKVNGEEYGAARDPDFPYNKNSVQFTLSSPSSVYPQHTFFRYRLSGGTTAPWQQTAPGEKKISFASLEPGNYVFEAAAINFQNNASKPVTYSFRIEKPWWTQEWFIGFMVMLVLGFFYGLYLLRLNQILKVEKMRRSLSNDLHDDIGATLSTLTIYAHLAKEEKENEEYLDYIDSNAREVISKLDDLVWATNPGNDSWEQLISRMQDFASAMFTGLKISCSFYYDRAILDQPLPVSTRRNIFLVFKEIVNNVARHAKAKNCSTRFIKQGRHVVLEVSDDGIGLKEKDFQKPRNGLKSMQERVEEMKGNLRIGAGAEGGTVVTVSIPTR